MNSRQYITHNKALQTYNKWSTAKSVMMFCGHGPEKIVVGRVYIGAVSWKGFKLSQE